MNFSPTFSPSTLSYMAALKGGVKPRALEAPFTYAIVNCQDPDLLAALAASNPKSRFYGLVPDAALCAQAEENARLRQVSNVSFLRMTLPQALEVVEKKNGALPPLDYLCCDESKSSLSASDRAALYDLAAKIVRPGGLLALTYQPCASEEENLRFLVREFAPEMSASQACVFLLELRKLGGFFFRQHAVLAAKLDQAIARNMPDEFFSLFENGEARSKTFDTVVGLGPRGFTYAGDSSISASYIELSVPPEAQQVILDCRGNPLYEAIKDFAQNRTLRGDVWCRQPAVTSANPVELFGAFRFGIPLPRHQVPASVEAQGKSIALDSPLYTKLIDIMTLMPAGIGDILAHPDGKAFAPEEVVGAVQILAACGIARPMRGGCRSENIGNVAQPRLVGAFNRYLDKTSLTGQAVSLASPVLGDAMTIPPRDALVMQALNRVGLANSVSALLPELQRLAQNPSHAARVMDSEPTAESAKQMIEDVVSHSIVQWYAYGLLEAA